MSILETGADFFVHKRKEVVLVSVALGVHILNFSIMPKNYKLPFLVGPSIASCLFVLSSACLLLHYSPKRPPSLSPGQMFSTDALECVVILVIIDLQNFIIWISASKAILYFVDFLEQYLHEVLPENNLKNSVKYIVHNHMFYAMRFMLALMWLIIVLQIYKLNSKIWHSFVNWLRNPGKRETHLMSDKILLPRRRSDRESSTEREISQERANARTRGIRRRITKRRRT